MNDRPTPETDAMIETDAHRIEEYSAPLTAYRRMCELAKTLEREREKLAEAAKLIADEYEDRRCQYGGDYLWTKHEQTEAIENALAIINEYHHERPTNTRD